MEKCEWLNAVNAIQKYITKKVFLDTRKIAKVVTVIKIHSIVLFAAKDLIEKMHLPVMLKVAPTKIEICHNVIFAAKSGKVSGIYRDMCYPIKLR